MRELWYVFSHGEELVLQGVELGHVSVPLHNGV